MRPQIAPTAVLTLTLLAVSMSATPAWAGPNEGGTLILHAIGYPFALTGHIPDEPCGASEITECTEAVTQGESYFTHIWWVLAAFPAGSRPDVAGIVFGIEYDSEITIIEYDNCGDFELPNEDWPASGEGTAVTFVLGPLNGLLNEIYWFAGYEYYGIPSSFGLIPHPTQGGFFGDSSVPSILDPIADCGILGFNQEGYLPCPEAPVPTIGESWGEIKRRF